MAILCLDIGGTEIKSMLKREDFEKTLANFPSKAGTNAPDIRNDVFSLVDELKNDYDIDGIAISTAGMVDYKTGIIAGHGPTFKNYKGFDWKKEIKDELGIPAVVENDVKAAAMGELTYGAGKGFNSAFVLTVGTGIGGALILDGKIHRGASGHAGEIGYMPFETDKFEALASTSALVKNSQKFYPDKNFKNGKIIFNAIDDGDEDAIKLVDDMTRFLARGIANIMLIVNPELILIGGGISEQKEKFLDPIIEKVRAYVPENIFAATRIKATELGNKSGLYGAYAIYKQNIK
ncbi:ROK family protein [uncultured Anaerococcus sp.]|uniref:ROK family protein n=1 Tax=uncultured Anaerococcus sp. TaxID=293428 RepID=UPI00288A3CC5|nr:ROK family protein [uncultured Anaerococcus sp.]